MRNLVVSFVLLSLLMFFVATVAVARIADDSLVLYLAFDEGSGDKVMDSTEYGNHGTLEGLSDKPLWVGGRYGTALEFYANDTNNWVEVPHSDSLGITGKQITLMAWVLNKGQETWGRIMDKNHPYLLYMGADESLGGYVGGGVVDFHSAATPVFQDEWIHVASVFDGSEMKLYVNGEMSASTGAPGEIPAGSRPLTIGDAMGDTWMHTRYFIGGIDEVRIYNRVLDDDEIEASMEFIDLAVRHSSEKLAVSWGRIKTF